MRARARSATPQSAEFALVENWIQEVKARGPLLD
jgi:hypothetical protein